MKVYAGMDPRLPLRDVAEHARRVEAMGYDGLHVAETIHDPFMVSTLALEHTSRIVVRTSVALAFVRSPLLVAYQAWDLAQFSGGRFHLGVGTQIRQNIEDRYGMPWHEPVPRLRDYVGALDDLFAAFGHGGRVHHEGDHYRITRLQPYFNPGPDPTTTPPPLWLGGVNAQVCRFAGERAAGFVTHPTNSNRRYLETIALPQIEAGLAAAGRTRGDLELVVGMPVITGPDDATIRVERERQRRLFAFLYSTPAYRRTLELYDLADLAPRLQAMIRDDRWDDLHRVVDDDVLDLLVPAAPYASLAALFHDRLGGLADGVLVPPPTDPAHDPAVAAAVAALHETDR
jgi:probable F420-dependent oxidoreductase